MVNSPGAMAWPRLTGSHLKNSAAQSTYHSDQALCANPKGLINMHRASKATIAMCYPADGGLTGLQADG